ncbi:bifunctional metallophosphatase/5'-nucleotidase [Chloroflexota bacterium]
MILAFNIIIILLVITGSGISCTPFSRITKLTILHTNDTRAHLDDIGRRATDINQIRSEVGDDNTILLDAGDVFGGTLYYNQYKGQADLWFMQQLGYDAMCPGNHEFDDGVKPLSDFISGATFPVLCANFDFSNESNMVEKPVPWTIIKKDVQQYGVFGLTTEETGEISSPGKNIVINNHITVARKVVEELNKKGINKIIAITHLGWQKDMDLAREVAGIDVIIGGHTVTIPDTYPAVVINNNIPVLVPQAGEFGKYLGRLDIIFDESGIIQRWEGSHLLPIDDKIPEIPELANKLNEYREPFKDLMSTVIGETLVSLDGERNSIRTRETNLGNLITDAMLAKAKTTGATIAIVNSGAIRVSIPAGSVTLGQVMEVLPFDNYLVVIDITGEQLIAALENGVSQFEEFKGRFPQVSGIRFTWNPDNMQGNHIVSVDVKTDAGYRPIDLSANYRVAISNFMYQGGDGYTVFQNGKNFTNISLIDYEVLVDYLKANSPVNPQIDGRNIR